MKRHKLKKKKPEKIYDLMIVTMNWIYHVYKHLNKITTQRHHLQKIKVIFKDICNGELKITQNTYLYCDTDYEGLLYPTITFLICKNALFKTHCNSLANIVYRMTLKIIDITLKCSAQDPLRLNWPRLTVNMRKSMKGLKLMIWLVRQTLSFTCNHFMNWQKENGSSIWIPQLGWNSSSSKKSIKMR